MELEIAQVGPDGWRVYASISPKFVVHAALDCEPVNEGLGGILLSERPVDKPYEKCAPDEGPEDWAKRFNLKTWGLFLAKGADRVVGAAAVAPPSPGIVVTEGRSDAACLWDLRVSASDRRHGVGSALLRRCANWAKQHGFRLLAIETQNVNVPACRCYAKNDCKLVEIRRFGYAGCPEVADEAMLIWHMTL